MGLGFTLLALGSGLPMALHAQSTNFNGTVALSSQLVDRGQAITRNTPILQGAMSWTFPAGWAVGVSGSTEVHSPGRVVEALVQASRFWLLSGDWQMQTSALYYKYPGSTHSRAYDRAETGVNWTYRDVLTLGVSAIYVLGAKDHRPRGAADASFHWPLAGQFSLSAGTGVAQAITAPYGPYRYGRTGSYRRARTSNGLHGYGHAGLSWGHGPWRVEFERILADPATRRQWDALGASPWVATISRSF
jgi:uncharacterized protein (TIGR02001 family)